MNVVDRQAIEDLFTRLKEAERTGGPRDTEAEAMIARLVARQPAAAYYLAQTVLVQQWALNAAHEENERLQNSGLGGGILSGLFGGKRKAAAPSHAPRPAAQPEMPAGIGFLAGASQTALGVAGGFILIDILANNNFSDSAFAASPDAPQASDAGGSPFGFFDMGGGGDGGGGGE